MRSFRAKLIPSAVVLCTLAGPAFTAPQEEFAWDERVQGPLPRWREGGTPPVDPSQPLHPYAIQVGGGVGQPMPPTSGYLASPPEYSPSAGVLFRYSTSSWSQVVTDCVVALTADPTKDDVAYVVVGSAFQQTSAINQFTSAGADLSKVQFLVQPTDSIWIRDYGPHFVWQGGALAVADSHYYPTRPQDNFIPTLVAEENFEIPPYPMGLYYSGGNFQPGPNRSGFVTTLVQTDNPGFGDAYIAELYRDYQGIDTLHILPRLPSSVDGTGHIDMWMYIVDEDDVMISEFKPGSNPTAITVTNNAVPYMQALGFNVTRIPAWNVGSTHYTYANAFRVNDRILIPSYGQGNPAYLADDAAAYAAWRAAAGPGVEIIPINCFSIIPAAGAVHCIVMQVPLHTAPDPSVHVVAPDGGELLVPTSTVDLRWAASDDVAVTSVDIEASLDGGATYPITIAIGEPNDGHYAWTVPPGPSTNAVVRVTAYDGAGGWNAAVSAAPFEVKSLARRVYDFSTGAGVDKWAWGSMTTGWHELDGVRHPAAVSTSVETLKPGAYAALAASDATGGDADPNRYISPVPTSGRETTHIFEFKLDEDLASIRDVEIKWEGYGDMCLQMELYLWDDVAGNWCDADAKIGENGYFANYTGNRDWNLIGNVRSDFDRFIDASGKLTMLVYGERPGQESFHDYVSVTTTYVLCQPDLGYGGPGTGVLTLCGDDLLLPGASASLELAQATPAAPVALFAGFSNHPISIAGGTLVPVPWVIADLSLSTDAFGRLAVEVPSPGVVPTTLYVQTIVLNGSTLEFSNALQVGLGIN